MIDEKLTRAEAEAALGARMLELAKAERKRRRSPAAAPVSQDEMRARVDLRREKVLVLARMGVTQAAVAKRLGETRDNVCADFIALRRAGLL